MRQTEHSGPFMGLATKPDPASPRFQAGMAQVARNLRIREDDLLARRPGLSAYVATRVPVTPTAGVYTIRNLWVVHFDDSDGEGAAADYLIVKTGDGDGDDDGKLYWTALPPGAAPSWAEIKTAAAASLGLADDEPGTAFLANDFFYYSDSVKAYGWRPAYDSGGGYWDAGEAFEPGLAPPAAPTATAEADATSRILKGARNVVATHVDKTRFVTGLPSTAAAVTSSDIPDDNAKKLTLTSNPSAGENAGQQAWRSPRTSPPDYVVGDLSHFNFITDIDDSSAGTPDRRGDTELLKDGRLNCRGGRPLPCRYAVWWRGRAYYGGYTYNRSAVVARHKDNTAGTSYDLPIPYLDRRLIEWSSAGRPEEVARKYKISINAADVEQLPELQPGLFMEARTWLPDEAGGVVTGMAGFGEEVLVCSERQITAILGAVEPFPQRIVSYDVGLCSHRALVRCGDWGLAGADSSGPWIFDGQQVHHVGRAMLELADRSATQINLGALADTHSIYVRELHEVWWLVSKPESTVKDLAIAWQADRGVFAGPYKFALGGAGIEAAATVVLAGAEPVTVLGLSSGYVVKVDDSCITDYDGAAARGTEASARLWFGSDDPQRRKHDVAAEIVYASITAGKDVSVRLWTGDAVDTAEIDTLDFQPHRSTAEYYPVLRAGPEGAGRFAALDIVLPPGCRAPISRITLRARIK